MAEALTTIEEAQAAVREWPPGARMLARGGGTKPALSTALDGAARLDVSGLAGVLEYEPSEFTFTALAGTRLSEVNTLLDDHGQYLPFDPPLAEHGATLGGTIAAGLSGPGRYRYGGARDFLIGVRFVDGEGRLVRGGGKVVKNAAGFDLPKLMVGSLGGLGLLVEMSFKVFPKPEAFATVRLDCAALADARQAVARLYSSQLDLDALDFTPATESAPTALYARLGGLRQAMQARLDRLRGLLSGGEAIEGADEAALWRGAREFEWAPAGWSLIKVPLTPGRIPAVEDGLAGRQTLRRYSGGGQVLWLASPEAPPSFDGLLREHGLAGLAILGPAGQARIGARAGEAFARRAKQALDPGGRFV
jgi:glycolate oxidase FAD binding subunit